MADNPGKSVERTIQFPKGFLWGAATAAHQVEGNNQWNDWWFHEQNGDLPYVSGVACNHYQCYREDFALAKSWSHNAHRLSIEWSRVEPREGVWSNDALNHYARVIATLRGHEIEPFITLHHFTNPEWFSRSGGWLRKDSTRLFTRFISHLAQKLDQVKFWLTINEPTVLVKKGYSAGVWPPFEGQSPVAGARVLLSLARAHVSAYERLHEMYDDVSVGFAHSAPYVVPCGHGGWPDNVSALARDFVLNDLFFLLLKRYGKRIGISQPFDYIGLNYYTRTIVRSAVSRMNLFGEECRSDHHADLGEENELGWITYPRGIYEVVQRFSRYGVPIFITENGIATSDDNKRIAFLREHILQLARAIRDGADVRGYFHWTLLDNYEWAHGPEAHFGLAAVDLESGERLPRRSSAVYADICAANRIDDV